MSRALRIRLFIAVHVAAVAAMYGIALVVGGGWISPPIPASADRHAAALPRHDRSAEVRTVHDRLPIHPLEEQSRARDLMPLWLER